MKTDKLKAIIESDPALYDMRPSEAARALRKKYNCTEKKDTLRKQFTRLKRSGWEPSNHAEREVTGPTGICELAQDYYYNEVDDKYVILKGFAGGTVIDGEVVRGNHDNMTSLALNRVLIEAYRRCDGVSVVEASCEPWYMIALGKAHLYFEHGDGPKGAKITPIMAKVRKDLWGYCNHHYAFTGHLHHMKVLDDYGVVHIQMPSLARPDRYHAKGGWLTATRAQEAYVFDEDGFLFDTVRALG